MGIRRPRLTLVGLSVALLCFAGGSSADPRTDAMVERVLAPLNAAMGLLTHPGDLTPDDREHAVDAIQAAIYALKEYQQGSH